MADAARHAEAPAIEPAIEVGQVVTGPPDPVSWTVSLGTDGVRIRVGADDSATVTFTQDLETAVAIHQGRLSTQAAFTTGRLQVRGDVRVLLTHQHALGALDDAFATVRSTTTYDLAPDASPSAGPPAGRRS